MALRPPSASVATLIAPPAAIASDPPPILYGSAALEEGLKAALINPDVLPGANLAGCRPLAPHPYPVVIVEGTGAALPEYATLAALLSDHGYCVFAANYGDNALSNLLGDRFNAFGDVASSAAQLSIEVNHVLTQTGRPRLISWDTRRAA